MPTKYSRRDARKKDDNGCLPLHRAAIDNDITKIRKLVNVYAEGIRTKDNDGDLPLHCAVDCHCAPVEVVKYLVEAYPDGVNVKNNDGDLPLHRAVSCHCAPFEVIKYLVETTPNGVYAKNNDGDLPLHCAANIGRTLEIVKCLVEAYADGVREKTNNGCLPLHCCAVSSGCNVDPVHMAARKNRLLEVVKYLVEAYPDGVREKAIWTDLDGHFDGGQLPVHAAAYGGAPLEIVKYLVEAFPKSLRVKDIVGRRRPLDAAKFQDAPPDVIAYLESREACANCGRTLRDVKADGGKLRVCSGCSGSAAPTLYCSTACQKAAWPQHKRECRDDRTRWSDETRKSNRAIAQRISQLAQEKAMLEESNAVLTRQVEELQGQGAAAQEVEV